MTLLSIVQDACGEVGISQPASVISNTDTNTVQMLALANRGGKVLSRRGQWTVLNKEHTFNTAASTAAYALPSDFDYVINETVWDRANYWKFRGAISAPVWQAIKSGLVTTVGLRKGYRIKGATSTQFYIDPTPTATEACVYEYQSVNWCADSSATGQSKWAADDDVGVLSEDLLTEDLVWRWLRAKGLDYAEEMRTFELDIQAALGREAGAPILNMGESSRSFYANIQDSDYPS
jgi:hypothetical protein